MIPETPMKIYDLFFWAAAFFLLGALAASFVKSFALAAAGVLAAALLFAVLSFVFEKKNFFAFSFLIFFAFAGFSHYHFYSAARSGYEITFDKRAVFEGVVVSDPDRGGDYQKFILNLEGGQAGRVLAEVDRFPTVRYGDRLKIKGVAKKPFSDSYAAYLRKDSVFGTLNGAGFEIVAENQASKARRALFLLKEKAEDNFRAVLPSEEAAFLSGIVLGERAEFSEEFKENLNLSGTSHLVALSGYNITILANLLAVSFAFLISRAYAFWPSVLAIVLFVAMTGAEASVVRAAIMGIVALVALRAERIYSFRNAVIFAAFLMAVFNPLILRFDLGFQLSFAALLGIVYLRPAIGNLLRAGARGGGFAASGGLLNWRENALTTVSAQLAVLPILMVNFGTFSPLSFPANVLILGIMPVTMALGFAAAAAGFVSYHLALFFGWIVHFLLRYKILIISAFADLSRSFVLPAFGFSFGVVYYLLLIGFIIYSNRKFYGRKS